MCDAQGPSQSPLQHTMLTWWPSGPGITWWRKNTTLARALIFRAALRTAPLLPSRGQLRFTPTPAKLCILPNTMLILIMVTPISANHHLGPTLNSCLEQLHCHFFYTGLSFLHKISHVYHPTMGAIVSAKLDL